MTPPLAYVCLWQRNLLHLHGRPQELLRLESLRQQANILSLTMTFVERARYLDNHQTAPVDRGLHLPSLPSETTCRPELLALFPRRP